jgi:hypothetical protein
MAATSCIQCRIDSQLKSQLRALAAERGLTESAVLKRLVVGAVGMAPANDASRLVHNLIFSMPKGTPSEKLAVAVRAFVTR